ncbi:glycosyltransferase [Proteus vulgaris]|uniref:glycosyltransferase n=1 Tax=Proteus vulgaris TaxID=585 RepID=UPI0018E4BF6E|nr:glycosyltransferase [Proteus vulgaris]MBI6528373.1 glycosyltransferase [Proteus vulgaris]
MKITKLTPPLSEKEILDKWIYTDITYISIICCTYNQELYISDAINSFLAQKTKYKFEIIIHDDCSTDGTNNILNSFKEKYPNILKIIKPEENLYSKYGVNAPGLNAISQSLGKYIALCEGDDFWIDEYKIQKQFITLEKNDDINICFTSTKKLFINDKLLEYANYGNKERKFDLSDVIIKGGSFIPTASILVRKKALEELPNWFIDAPVGDYFLQMYCSKSNGAIYLPHTSCVYRVNSAGSWSSSRKKITAKNILNFCYQMCNLLSSMKNDDGFNGFYIDKAISTQETIATYQLIKNKYFTEAEELIFNSWRKNRNSNKNQKILFYMRKFFKLFPLIIFIKDLKNRNR